MQLNTENLVLKIAQSDVELRAAQHLRYRVFVQEMGAQTSDENHALQLERDRFDAYFDHLILIDTSNPNTQENVVGVYRLMRNDVAQQGIGFYGADEYDLSTLEKSNRRVLELGRSCVDARFRGGAALHLLWNGLAQYVHDHQIEVLFGVASFHGRDVEQHAQALSLLHHNHLAPDDLCVTAQAMSRVDMDILAPQDVNKLAAMRQMPPLIKAYLRLGGCVGQGAFVDHHFNTVDVCLVMDTQRMSAKHKAMYQKGVS
jgi:putative hemolysin